MSRRSVLWTTLPTVALTVAVVGALVFAAPWNRGVLLETVSVGDGGTEVDWGASFDHAFQVGIGALQSGRTVDAVQAFETATRFNPRSPEAQVNLGFAYLMAERSQEAVDAFKQAIDLRPGQVNAYYGLAEAQEQRGDLTAATAAMRTYIHLAAADDPFKRRAMSAVWEWEAAAGSTAAAESGPAMPMAPTAAVSGRPVTESLRDVTLVDVSGRIVGLDRYAGKVIVVNIWATWCGPCRAELASLQRLSERLDPERAVVIGLSIDKDAVFVREYLRDIDLTFDNYVDSEQALTRDLLGIEMVPYTLLIGPDGFVSDRLVGIQDWDKADVATLQNDHEFRLAGWE